MNTNELQQRWPELKKRIMAEYPDTKEDELKYEIGKEAELLESLKTKLKMNKEQMDKWLSFMG